MIAKSAVDQRLVISATSFMNLRLEPFKEIVIQTNGNAGFPRNLGKNWAALGLGKIVLFSHLSFS